MATETWLSEEIAAANAMVMLGVVPSKFPTGPPRRRARRGELAELQFDIQSLCDRDPLMQQLLDKAKEDAMFFRH